MDQSKVDNELLFQLAKEGDLETLSKYPYNTLSTSCRDKNGSTLLHYAAGNGHEEMCDYLIANHILAVDEPSRTNGRTALHWAARNGRTLICVRLVQWYGANVDALAKGQVTPLQLAIWQCHLETSKCLVHTLNADPHFPNAWGCGMAHWLGKSPKVDNGPLMTDACKWLFGHCQVDCNLPNHHGQTPLHKAAFAGNDIVVRYLVQEYEIVDRFRDHHGNLATDCAERSQHYVLAQWLRRFASEPIHITIQSLELQQTTNDDNNNNNTLMPPTLDKIRSAYMTLAKQYHPDKACRNHHHVDASTTTTTTRWNEIQDAYSLLQSWWNDPPEFFDCQIRIRTRNARLLEHERLCWILEWHEQQQQQQQQQQQLKQAEKKKASTKNLSRATETENKEELEEFQRRLVRLLSNDDFCRNGLPLSQLPKEYEKNWHVQIPKPRQFGCRKLIYLLQTKCPKVHVDDSSSESNQPVLRVAI
eukprot:scaffold822_cov130-Cylindrotheca_fusiformis.AAC.5